MKAKLARAVILQLESDQEASCRRSSLVGRAGRADGCVMAAEEDGEAVEEMAGAAGAVAAEEDEVTVAEEVVAEDVEEDAEEVETRVTNFQVESGVAV